MQAALLKRSHEDLWLQEGFLLAMQFIQGWFCCRILGWEHSNVKPYVLTTSLAANSNLGAWDELKDASARRYTMAPDEKYIHHYFWGVNKPAARVFFQYPTKWDRSSLVAVQRAITGDVGYVDGDMSPYDGPFSLKTEFMTVKDLYPAFEVRNPLPDPMPLVALNLDVMRYTYQAITNEEEVRRILLGDRRRRMYTVGGIDPNPVSAPSWLETLAGGKEHMSWTLKVMRGEV